MSTISGYPQLNFNNPFQRTRGPKMNAPTPQFGGGMFPTPPLRYGSAPMMTSPAITSSAPTMSAAAPNYAPSPGPAPLPVGPSRYALDDAKNNIRTADTEHDAAAWRMSHSAPQPGQIDVTGFPQINPIQWGMSHPAPSPVEVDHANYSEASRFNADAHSRIAATPPLPREMFEQQGDIARAYAQAPVAVAEARGNAVVDAAAARANGQIVSNAGHDKAKTDAATTTADGKLAGTKLTLAEKGRQHDDDNFTKQMAIQQSGKNAETAAASRAEVMKLRAAMGGKAGDQMTEQQKALVTAYGRTDPMELNPNRDPKNYDPNKPDPNIAPYRPRTFEARLAEAQQMMKAGLNAGPATQKPTDTEGYVNGVPPQQAQPQGGGKPTRGIAQQYVQKFGPQAAAKLKADGYDVTGYAD